MAGKAFGKTKTVGKPVNGDDTDNELDASSNLDSTRINGGDGNDSIVGSDAADRVNAGDGDDTVTGGAGDDILFGNGGTDTAVFSGSILDYVWAWSNGNTLNVSGADGDDQLKHFEYLQFDDFTYSTDGDNAPVAVLRGPAETEENTAFALAVDVYDFDGDEVSLVSVSSGRGAVSATEGHAATQDSAMGSSEGVQISFDPGTDFDYLAVGEETTETITLVIEDSSGNQTTTSFDITVTGSNDAPVAQASSVSGDEDTAILGTVLGTDVDNGAVLTYALESGPGNGSVVVNADGSFTYLGDSDFNGVDSFEFRVTDEHGAWDVQTVDVTVNPVNDAPVTGNGSGSVTEDGSLIAGGNLGASDVDGDTLSYTIVGGGTGAYGSLSIDALGNWTYTLNNDSPVVQALNAGDAPLESFTVNVSDGNGGVAVASVDVTVNGADEPETGFGLAQEHLALGSNVGITTWGNYSYASTSNEPYNLQQAVQAFGYNTAFTGATTEADMASFLSGMDALIVSEMERASYPSAVTAAIEEFVANGGTMVVIGTARSYDVELLNETFGWSLSESSWSGADSYQFDATEAAGTVFEDNVATMPWNNGTYGALSTANLPEGSLAIYDRGGDDDFASVAVMGHGEGQVTWLSYDWFNAVPNGTQDGGWNEALRDALSVALPETTLLDFEGLPLQYGNYGEIDGYEGFYFGPFVAAGPTTVSDGIGVWDTDQYGYTGVNELAALTDGNIQGFTNYGVASERVFMATLDGSEFDFVGGWFNEMGFGNQNNDMLRLSAYRDGALIATHDFSIDSPTYVEPGFTDIDEIRVTGLEGSTYFVFDDFTVA